MINSVATTWNLTRTSVLITTYVHFHKGIRNTTAKTDDATSAKPYDMMF